MSRYGQVKDSIGQRVGAGLVHKIFHWILDKQDIFSMIACRNKSIPMPD